MLGFSVYIDGWMCGCLAGRDFVCTWIVGVVVVVVGVCASSGFVYMYID